MMDMILEFLYSIAEIALGWLPDSPFANAEVFAALKAFGQIMGYINYFVPIGIMLQIMTLYLGCVLIWYAARWLLRLAQYID